jgi:hypothetical protein
MGGAVVTPGAAERQQDEQERSRARLALLVEQIAKLREFQAEEGRSPA